MRLIAFCFAASLSAIALAGGPFPSTSDDHKAPAGWMGPVFQLSQDYPPQAPPVQPMPWDQIDFKTQPRDYIRALLDYALRDINLENDTHPGWYHAPWLHYGCMGREFIHGLTMERAAPPKSIHSQQTKYVNDWAVGLYNAPGGYTIGQVWAGAEPDPSKADFPVGTVSIKFLFTTGDVDQVPFLVGSPEWQANVYPDVAGDPCRQNPVPARINRSVRLLQVDVAAREGRLNSTTGWVYGTFIFSGGSGTKLADQLQPVGLMWGNDPTVTSHMNQNGAFQNSDLLESWINTDLLTPPDAQHAGAMHFGLGGRVNGPVDNPISSCLSCHSMAAVPSLPLIPSGQITPANYPMGQFATFFANIGHGPLPTTSGTRLDYSLQLAAGIRNFYSAQAAAQPQIVAKSTEKPKNMIGAPVTRSGDDE
jgi:hypothetical protein